MNSTWGFILAAIAAISNGSFVVPTKGKAANSVDIDPLVFQTYKLMTFFVLSWLVLALGEKFVFTPWAILTALISVPGGTAGVFAIRTIGIAASVGIRSGTAVLISGLCGFVLFHEKLKSPILAALALLMMIIGLIGMSYTSAPSSTTDGDISPTAFSSSDDDDDNDDDREGLEYCLLDDETMDKKNAIETIYSIDSMVEESLSHYNEECFSVADGASLVADGAIIIPGPKPDKTLICGVKIPIRFFGCLAACFNGICAAILYVPMHYSEEKGLTSFILSFAIGVLIVLICSWSLRFALETHRIGSISKGYAALPSLHFRVIWFAGSLSGILKTMGLIGSMVAVDSIGFGLGMGISQSALIISGLWGIFYFHEVRGFVNIFGWFASAFCNLSGVLLLAAQHED